jgi:hypothetical protein
MEYIAMLRDMDFIPVGTHVVIETDLPMCTESLTELRKRWGKN